MYPYFISSLTCPSAVPCSCAPHRTPGSPWKENCIKDLGKPVLVSGAFSHYLMSKKERMRKVEGHCHQCWAAASSLCWQRSSLFSQGLGHHSPVCLLQVAVWALPRDELIFLEQEASSAAFEGSQTGARCQKKDDAGANSGSCGENRLGFGAAGISGSTL